MKSTKSKASKNTRKNRRRNARSKVNAKTNTKSFGRTNAPSAVSDDLQQFVRFGQGARGSTLRMHVRVPLYQVNSNYHDGSSMIRGGLSRTTTDSFPYVALGATAGYYAGGGTDTEKAYLSPALDNMGSNFVRYSMVQCRFLYEPQSSTATSDRLIFAFASDPEHPNIKGTPATASQSKLLALQDSVAFAPWRSWELDISQSLRSLSKDPLYTYNQDTQEYDNRFMSFGAIGCVPSVEPSSTTPMTVYGILYSDFIIDFIEMDPTNTTGPSLIQPSAKFLKELKKAGWIRKCSEKDCKACSKLCIYDKLAKEIKLRSQKED